MVSLVFFFPYLLIIILQYLVGFFRVGIGGKEQGRDWGRGLLIVHMCVCVCVGVHVCDFLCCVCVRTHMCVYVGLYVSICLSAYIYMTKEKALTQ